MMMRVSVAAVLACCVLASPWAVAAQVPPTLALLAIDLWPEYDRPGTVLVIYRGQFAPDAPVPAQVTLRIPATAGEPSAIASPNPGGEALPVTQWAELIAAKKVTTVRSGDWVEVTFSPLSRVFNLEFYDKLNTVTFDRNYTLIWPGDVAAEAVTLNVREPFGATNVQSTPALSPGKTDEEGLVAHQLIVGALEAAKPFVFSISYNRQDKRTSVEALQLATPVGVSPTVPVPVDDALPAWLVVMVVAVAVALMGGAAVWYTRSQRARAFRPYEPPALRKGRRSVRTSRSSRTRSRLVAPETEPEAGFCTQCGNPLRLEDVFCSRCGARVKGK